jgi:ferrous-iron efflux pump FieF
LTFALTRYLKRIARETNSTVLHADNAHFMSDLLANAAVIAGLLAVQLTGISLFDPLISLAIALVILYTAWGLLGESFQILTDHELPDETRKKIIEVLNDLPPPVTGWHLLRTRRVGTQSHVDYHLVLGEKVTLREAHDTAEKIEDTILEFLPKAVIMAHFDPDDDSERNMEMINNT